MDPKAVFMIWFNRPETCPIGLRKRTNREQRDARAAYNGWVEASGDTVRVKLKDGRTGCVQFLGYVAARVAIDPEFHVSAHQGRYSIISSGDASIEVL